MKQAHAKTSLAKLRGLYRFCQPPDLLFHVFIESNQAGVLSIVITLVLSTIQDQEADGAMLDCIIVAPTLCWKIIQQLPCEAASGVVVPSHIDQRS